MGGGRTSQLTGVSGVHFVASYVAYLGFHAVPTTRNVAGPDLLVSTLNGARSLSLQVIQLGLCERVDVARTRDHITMNGILVGGPQR